MNVDTRYIWSPISSTLASIVSSVPDVGHH
jgi:hypothetical protein